jgi:hypothetical protein
VWGRPICTAVYSVPALLGGRFGVRLMSLAMAIGCGLVAYRIAKNQGYRWPALALIFTLAQPLVFLHSFSELTELPFAFLLGLGFWAYQKRQWLVMAILIGFTPLSRPEGFGFVVLAAIALVAHGRWWWLPVLLIPLILWDYAGGVMYGDPGPWWNWLHKEWPYSPTSLYERGNILHFVLLMPAVASPFLFPSMCVGIWRSLLPLPPGEGGGEGRREGIAEPVEGPAEAHGSPAKLSYAPALTLTLSRWERGPEEAHRCVCQILIAVIPLLMLLGHSLLYATGKMASSGEIRYMLVVAPFWGLLSAYGWGWLFTRFNGRFPLRWAAVAALLPILANVYYKVVPLQLQGDWKLAERAVIWYQHSGIQKDFPRIATAHQGIFYFLDVATTGKEVVEWRKDNLATPTPGTVVIWDPMYSIYNSDAKRAIPLDELLRDGWIDVSTRMPTIGPDWHILLSPKDVHGSDVQETLHFPSPP